ncbi:MAG: hypothetical protein HY861_04650 [Chlamydiia bacterium]|nr:hypothetical protein [Chlamydiia bacterium]
MKNLRIPAVLSALLLIALSLAAQIPPLESSDNQKIAVQNSILAKVGEKSLSMIDVKKKMDLLFHQHYPQLSQSNQARCQFYEKSWRPIVMEMIDNELILADALDHDIQISDAEVREEMESRFGPHVLSTLDRLGFSYDEAWQLLKNELIVHRMSWWFVQSKAIQSVTPQDIRQAYQTYLQEHPAYQEIKYRIVSIRSEDATSDPESKAQQIHQFLAQSAKSPDMLSRELSHLDPSVQISPEYSVSDREITETHRKTLSALQPGQYSTPIVQKSRTDNKKVARIFYLIKTTDHPAQTFQDLAASLREQLTQQALAKQSQVYIEKLRKHYGFDTARIKESFPEDMHPFSLQ